MHQLHFVLIVCTFVRELETMLISYTECKLVALV